MEYRGQFHQHFARTFLVRKCFAQLFSSYVLALAKGFRRKKHFRTKKTLMKLTTVGFRCFRTWYLQFSVYKGLKKVKSRDRK